MSTQRLTPELQTSIMWVLQAFKFIVPCVYCRVSYTTFISTGVTNLNEFPRVSMCQWIYWMHENVNRKLFWQQVRQDVTQIWKWNGYQPQLQDVQYTLPSSSQWWFHTFTFAYYVMCDYPKESDPDYEERAEAIQQFFPRVAYILQQLKEPSGSVLRTSLRLSQSKAEFDTLPQRIAFVRQVENWSRTTNHVLLLPDDILRVCQQAIVGCDPKDKNKTGC